MTRECNEARWWLRGFFDGEGCVRTTKVSAAKGKKKKYSAWTISASNTEPSLIRACSEKLAILGIGFRIAPHHRPGTTHSSGGPWKDCWVVVIGRRSEMEKFAVLVGFCSKAKSKRMAAAVKYFNRPSKLPNWPKKVLRDLYVGNRMSVREVSQVLGTTRSLVDKRLKEYGFRIRGHVSSLKIAARRGRMGRRVKKG